MSDTPIPHVSIEDIAASYHEFETKLLTGDLPMPFWLDIGPCGFKITTENHRLISLGVHLGFELRNHFTK